MPYISNGGVAMIFNENAIKRNHNTLPVIEQLAKENGCGYFDVNDLVTPSVADGLHYTKESHKIIANHLAKFMKTISVLPRIL
jgi:hypothetical protein